VSEFFLSICILTHNRAALLAQCLESVRPQVLPSTEVVVSDNASTDNTPAVVQGFQGKIPNLCYYRNRTDLGCEENVFKVISRARGTYVVLLGDDDLLTGNALQLVRRALSGRSPDRIGVVLSSRRVSDSKSGRSLPSLEYYKTDRRFSPGGEALLGLFLYAHGLSGIVIRRDLIDLSGARRYLGSFYPQMYLVGRALKTSWGIYIAQPLVTVRINAGNYWEYSSDFMAGHIIRMIHELSQGEPPAVDKALTAKRIRYSIFSLEKAKQSSAAGFLLLLYHYFKIREYRHSFVFWLYAVSMLVLGSRVLRGMKKALYFFCGNRKILVNYLYGE
jgi:glycosyltransferase involved in cell wall biosynthesis